jgi:NAD(P)-dependent dehydrogenase (short-subunit alcohol dehydrogenase family)
MNKVWFITGANRGIGAEIAKAALASGDVVVVTGRNLENTADTFGNNASLTAIHMDVTDETNVRQAVAQAVAQHGRLDVVVNNAGYALLGALETTSDAKVRHQFDTNVFGLLNVTRAVLPQLRRQKAGHIINISSMQGATGAAASSSYSGSKFAVEGITESLQQEVQSLGIKVTMIEPGTFRTELLSDKSLHKVQEVLPDYVPTVGQTLHYVDWLSGQQPGDPQRLAAAIVRLTNEAEPPLRFLAGSDAVQYVTQALRHRLAEAKKWHELSVSTDFPPSN